MPVCKKCGNSFPNTIRIDGKWHNISKRVFCVDCSPFGMHNTRDLSAVPKPPIETKYCSQCKQILDIEAFFFNKSEGKYYSWYKKCLTDAATERHIIKKLMAIDYLGGKCIKCNFKGSPAAFDFHHRDMSEKEININQALKWSWERLVKELDKCDLMCSNCHRELHHPAESYEEIKRKLNMV